MMKGTEETFEAASNTFQEMMLLFIKLGQLEAWNDLQAWIKREFKDDMTAKIISKKIDELVNAVSTK